MAIKNLYTGSVLSLRGRSSALTTGIINLQELYNLITYQSLSTLYLNYPVDCVSASAVDTSAGTGAQQIEVAGLDHNYNFQTEIVTLNGQTAVTSTKSFLRVFSAEVVRSGSGMTNAGNIVVYKSGQGGTVAGGIPPTLTSAWLRIMAGFGVGYSGLYTVPRGKTVEATQLMMSARTQISDLYIVTQKTGIQEVVTLTVTAKPTANGNVTTTLDGVLTATVPVTTDDTIYTVATRIASYIHKGWTPTVSGAVVTFTSNIGILRAGANTFGAAATGTTATFLETVAGTSLPYITEYSFGTTNNSLVFPIPLNSNFRWGEKTDIYLRALSTTAGGVVSANLTLRPVADFS